MTDQEKMLQLLKMASEKAKEDEMMQLNNAASIHSNMMNAYMKAGFTRKEALQVTTELIKAMVVGGGKK